MRRKRSLLLAALLLAPVAAACQDPYARNGAPTTTVVAASSPSHTDVDRPGPLPRPIRTAGEARGWSAHATATAFASRWVNWDWQSVVPQQRRLADLAGGALARELLDNARSARVDASLARDQPGSRGTVQAVELEADGAGQAGIVVTREQTYTGGRAELGGRRYRVYRVRLTRVRSGWGVTQWEPQP